VLGLVPGYKTSYANGVNGSGLVVGTICCAKAAEPEAVVWHGTTPTLLATVQSSPYPAGKALAANNLGLVAGTATNAVGSTHAAAWANGVVTDLGALAGYLSSATAVNDRGVIVGESATVDDGEFHAALWSSVGAAPQDLNKLISAARQAEFLLSGAVGINNSCTIVANGYNRKTGNDEAFLLTLIDSSNCVNGM
jgi:probable HAF family extracellular repeat protein